MSTFMILYRSTASAREQMANATPQQREAGLEAWRTWATKVGYAITDLGAPLAHTTHIGPGSPSSDGVAGYSLLQAGSAEEVAAVLDGHPHLDMPGNHIEVLELLPMPGM